MTYHKKMLAVLILGAFLLSLPLSHAETGERGAAPHVGAVLPLTGELAYFGTALRRGIEMSLTGTFQLYRNHRMGV